MKRKVLTVLLALTIVFTSMPSFANEIVKGGVAAKEKIVSGKVVARSEFISMLHKAIGIQINYFKAPDITEHFDDVSNEDPYAMALYDLVTMNIVDDKEHFRPNEPLTREEMVHYIMNALKSVTGGHYATIKMMPEPFKDDDKITPIYKNDIIEARLLKLIYGTGKNKFKPKRNVTLTEATVVIERLMTIIKSLKEEIEVIPSAKETKGSLDMKLTISNNSSSPVSFQHTTGQKYDFVLLDANKNEVYRWSLDKDFMMMLTNVVIDPSKSLEYSETLDAKTYKSIKDKITYIKGYIVGTSDTFNINTDGYEITVK